MKKYALVVMAAAILVTACKKEKSVEEPGEVVLIENGLLPAVQIDGEPLKTYTLEERMDFYNVPGLSIAIVVDGKLNWAKGYGDANTSTGTKVNTETLFQAGSISKPLAALCALKLIDEGKINLDEDVNTYLKDWQIPDSDFTTDEKVTLRRLLTHTAGTTVHGFPGYMQKDSFPTVIDVLDGKGNTDKIVVDTIPGSRWKYSGGGYTIMEKVVEDVSGMPLEDYAAQNVLGPLSMDHSTYEQPLGLGYQDNASAAYNGDGEIIEGYFHNYPEQAAAGLWTTPSDLARYCIEIQNIVGGKENGILTPELVNEMLTLDQNGWGLGPQLNKAGDSMLFGHGGKNAGFTNNFYAFVHKGQAAIVMTNADQGGSLIGEIMRAISNQYNWDVNEYRTVKRVNVAEAHLKELVGTYKIGDYPVEIKLDSGTISAYHPGAPDGVELIPEGEMNFVDSRSGDDLQFQIQSDSTKAGLMVGGNQFVKVE